MIRLGAFSVLLNFTTKLVFQSNKLGREMDFSFQTIRESNTEPKQKLLRCNVDQEAARCLHHTTTVNIVNL